MSAGSAIPISNTLKRSVLEFEGRNVVASSTGLRALFAAFEKTVVVRDLRTGGYSGTFETTFDAGGERLALSDQLDGLVAAAYHVHGLAFYCCATGQEKWRRKDLKKIQVVTLSRNGLVAYCGRASASLVQVDLRSGDTMRSIRGARALYESSFDSVQFLDVGKPQVLSDEGARVFYLERTTFAFLDVKFAPGVLIVSEADGPIRCIDVVTGKERWRYQPKKGHHVLRLGYREADSSLLGIEWPFEKGGAKTLITWSLKNGEMSDRRIIGHPVDCCFGVGGQVIVMTDGKILPTSRELGAPMFRL